MKALRITAFAEAVTLILLVCVAVPLKYILGMPAFVAALGPVHGVAFIVFLVVTMYALGEGLHQRTLAGPPSHRDALATSNNAPQKQTIGYKPPVAKPCMTGCWADLRCRSLSRAAPDRGMVI